MATKWLIDKVPAGLITRNGVGGHYTVRFDKSQTTLADIEGIRWEKPEIQNVGADDNEIRLPEGYGFRLIKITYSSLSKQYEAELETDTQYLGDVTGYQEEIAGLRTELAEADELAISLYEALSDTETRKSMVDNETNRFGSTDEEEEMTE